MLATAEEQTGNERYLLHMAFKEMLKAMASVATGKTQEIPVETVTALRVSGQTLREALEKLPDLNISDLNQRKMIEETMLDAMKGFYQETQKRLREDAISR